LLTLHQLLCQRPILQGRNAFREPPRDFRTTWGSRRPTTANAICHAPVL